ncbi:LptE family protein [Winogradskyella sp. UBA3174]|uniref:LptE family protein n=1 Tax=Winogradskyella sp. UBA3174 TaxID=1947785 RepID=UPI0025F2A020|nr:LptE family protein [Winogradskyella sp. UBA3174]|tara:strand:- start:13902 stop:14405 length:504 start_codon:yes stop_codon:yes gene_type:complete
MKHLKFILLILASYSLVNCSIYSFTGADTGDAKTFQVNFFQNNAELVEPGLDIDFTNALQDLIQNQTNLNLTTLGADLIFEGEITEYRIAPMTATAQNTAAQNRLTIGVNVRYINTKNEEKDFEKRFSFFFDYPANAQLTGGTKDEAFEVIFERLTQDIFNASLANW